MEWLWKGFTLILGVVLVPTFGWVWTMQMQMTSIKKDMEYSAKDRIELHAQVSKLKTDKEKLEEKVNTFTTTSTDVTWLKTSLETLNSKLDRIETRLVNF